jgi:hypothetical protein
MKARSTRMRYYDFDFRRLLVNLFLRFWQCAQKGAWRTGSGWRRRQGGGWYYCSWKQRAGLTTLTDLLVAATIGYGCSFHIQSILHYDRQMLYVALKVRLYSWIISLLPAESTTSEGSLYIFLLSANSIYNWQEQWQPSLNRDCNPYTNGHAEGIFKLAPTHCFLNLKTSSSSSSFDGLWNFK